MSIDWSVDDPTADSFRCCLRRVLWSFFQQPAGAEPGSDVQAALDGYVAVTPLVASEFSQSAFDELQKRIR
ncbi:MAG: hypothetical protein M3468_00420 [Acidobacteriota bacterium]|nr:hypothetical protein [Acidobacteriota bacterium]